MSAAATAPRPSVPGGIITLADLAAAQPTVRTPLRRRVWGMDWMAFPPPSSSATVLAALQILAGAWVRGDGVWARALTCLAAGCGRLEGPVSIQHRPSLHCAGYPEPLAGAGALGVHRSAEALKHAFALRMSLGDPGPEGSDSPYLNLTAVLAALGSSHFIDSLR